VPSPRLARLDPASRNRLTEVAIRHFGAEGFERASLNRIIAEAGLGKSSYYYYFEDKRDLFLETLRVAIEGLYADVPYPTPPRSKQRYWPTLEAHMQRMVQAVQARPHLIAFFSKLERAQVTDPHLDSLRARARELYLPMLRAGQELGCVRRDVALEVLAELWEAADLVLDRTATRGGRTLTPARMAAHATLAFDLFRRVFEETTASAKRAPAHKRKGP